MFSLVSEHNFTPVEDIATVVYEAATDSKDKLRYIAGEDAKALFAQRLELGQDAFVQQMEQQFLANPANSPVS